jgi:hypothetical protein
MKTKLKRAKTHNKIVRLADVRGEATYASGPERETIIAIVKGCATAYEQGHADARQCAKWLASAVTMLLDQEG